MKAYPLKIENCGEDTYILMSRGHHPPKEFMEAVRAYRPDWSMGKPEHLHWKFVPCSGGAYNGLYAEVSEGTRGSFPVTVTQEAYGEDRYQDCASQVTREGERQ